ncbi:hypothetical protein Bca52824_090447 [Brassica carinata]|uniref:Uncharacterized protein n=1 Tax=Brassica carinata TaxID=52824 RepID=A0A8X7TGG3_BRACI|nr:hypothetical protein Bca52824_090447 [Brassica carinata]
MAFSHGLSTFLLSIKGVPHLLVKMKPLKERAFPLLMELATWKHEERSGLYSLRYKKVHMMCSLFIINLSKRGRLYPLGMVAGVYVDTQGEWSSPKLIEAHFKLGPILNPSLRSKVSHLMILLLNDLYYSRSLQRLLRRTINRAKSVAYLGKRLFRAVLASSFDLDKQPLGDRCDTYRDYLREDQVESQAVLVPKMSRVDGTAGHTDSTDRKDPKHILSTFEEILRCAMSGYKVYGPNIIRTLPWRNLGRQVMKKHG